MRQVDLLQEHFFFQNYIKALRFFCGDPVWTPVNRPADDHAARVDYLRKFQSAWPLQWWQFKPIIKYMNNQGLWTPNGNY